MTNHVGGGYHGDNSRQEIMTVGPESPTETALIATVAVKYLKVQKSDSHDTLKILNALKVTYKIPDPDSCFKITRPST